MAVDKSPRAWLLARIDRLCLFLCGLASGLGFAQFPQYLAQYLQRLGGHLDEARDTARLFALPELAQRAERLAEGMQAIIQAPPLLKLPAFLRHAQWPIARRAWGQFMPGFTFSPEEICYLLAGALLGMAVYGAVKATVRAAAGMARQRAKRAKDTAQAAAGKEPPVAAVSSGNVQGILPNDGCLRVLRLFRLGIPARFFTVVHPAAADAPAVVRVSAEVYAYFKRAGVYAQEQVGTAVPSAELPVCGMFRLEGGGPGEAVTCAANRDAKGIGVVRVTEEVFAFFRTMGVPIWPVIEAIGQDDHVSTNPTPYGGKC